MLRSFDIERLYGLAKNYYKSQKNNFYISSKSVNGIHLGVYPDAEPLYFSEYVFGNSKDMDKIVKNAAVNIFKSFYCSMCAIEEPNNVSKLNTCQILEPVDNLALKINAHVEYNGIPFLVCGTTPQYYYNHLLLSTVEHYGTYMIFENEALFKGVMDFSTELAKQSGNSKLVFNGNFGSDIWHFHMHITDTAMDYVDSEYKILERLGNSKIAELNNNLGVVNYKVLASTSQSELFKRVSELTRFVYLKQYISREKYLSAVFKTVMFRGVPCHLVFLVTGNRSFPNVDNKEYLLFFPATALKTSDEVFSDKLINEISKSIAKKGCYENWDTVLQVEKPKYSTRAEFFENAYRKKCGINYLQNKDVNAIFQVVDSCILTKRSCGVENADTFATYKYAMSLIFICTTAGLRGDGRAAYKTLITNQDFLHHALKSGTAYLTNNYNIKDSRSLFLKGPVAGSVFEESFNNFNLITSVEGSIPTHRLTHQTPNVNHWVNFHPQNRLGKPSAMGIVYSSSLRQNSNIEFVIKTINPARKDVEQVALFFSEFAIGIKLNSLREKIPNFLITLGGFECDSSTALDTICQGNTGKGSGLMQFILLEKINNAITFADYVASSSYEKTFLCIFQLAAALQYAQKNTNFTHYDLHTDNVMVTSLSTGDDAYLYKYKIGDSIINVPSYVNCTIIDYGMAHVKDLAQYVPTSYENVYGYTRDRPNFNRDIFTIVIHTFLTVLAHKSGQDIEKFFSVPNPLNTIIKGLFESYSDIFHPDAFNIIMKTYENAFSGLRNPVEKTKYLVKLFTSSRKDGKYFLYLPTNYPYPSQGIYKSNITFIKELSNLEKSGLDSTYIVQIDPTKVYNWGDWEEVGCFMTGQPERTKLSQIKKLKLFLGAVKKKKASPPKPKSPPKKKASPPKEQKTKSPKPKSPPKKKASPPKEQKTKSPKPKSPPKKKASPPKGETEEDRLLLKEITEYNERNKTYGEYSKCLDFLDAYGRFWSKIENKEKKIKTLKDMGAFKRRIAAKFHPDKNLHKKEWATKMLQELNTVDSECSKFLN